MTLYKWHGPEQELAHACVACDLTIESVKEEDGILKAKGEFTGKDYVEHGIVFTDPWEGTAHSPLQHVEGEWTVRRTDDEEAFWRDNQTGEVHFTANMAINRAIKQFIAKKLLFVMKKGGSVEEETIAPYAGEMKTYNGECVCYILLQRNQHSKVSSSRFPWKELTEGKFPQHCFQCSCGKKWWCYDAENDFWAPVLDRAAWEMLLAHNGVEAQRMAESEGGFHLLQTLRNNGFVPLW